jgi:hypothetical protein
MSEQDPSRRRNMCRRPTTRSPGSTPSGVWARSATSSTASSSWSYHQQSVRAAFVDPNSRLGPHSLQSVSVTVVQRGEVLPTGSARPAARVCLRTSSTALAKSGNHGIATSTLPLPAGQVPYRLPSLALRQHPHPQRRPNESPGQSPQHTRRPWTGARCRVETGMPDTEARHPERVSRGEGGTACGTASAAIANAVVARRLGEDGWTGLVLARSAAPAGRPSRPAARPLAHDRPLRARPRSRRPRLRRRYGRAQIVRRITGTRKIPGDEPIVTLLRLNKGDPTAGEDDQLASEPCQVTPPAARESR